jgi:hypothetical protein
MGTLAASQRLQKMRPRTNKEIGLQSSIMQINGWKKAALGIGAAILLGGLGSGLWDLALKPGGQWFGHALFTLVTLGSKVLKDRVYLDAAKGQHEDAAIFTLLMLGAYGSLGLGMIAGRVSLVLGDTKRNPPETEAVQMSNFMVRLGNARTTALVVLLFLAFLLSLQIMVETKVEVANQAYTRFEQRLVICQPYLSERETQIFKSRFAALQSRDEYIGIMEDLKHVAAANQLSLPKFEPW